MRRGAGGEGRERGGGVGAIERRDEGGTGRIKGRVMWEGNRGRIRKGGENVRLKGEEGCGREGGGGGG